MRKMTVLVTGLVSAGCVSTSGSDYVQTWKGAPSVAVAEAQCQAVAAQAGQYAVLAVGDPMYVAGAELGAAVGAEINRSRAMKACMEVKGWKAVPKGKGVNSSMPQPVTRDPGAGPGPFPAAPTKR